MAREIYSLDEDKMVTVEDAPVDKAPPIVEDKKAEEEENEEETDPAEEEEEKDTEQEEPADGDKPEEVVEESEEDPDPDAKIDDFFQEKFSEKYGIENEAQFQEVLDRSFELLDENEGLKKEVEELKKAPKDPIFKSETQKAVYDAIKDYDPERIPDGIQMMAGLINMDLDKTDPKLILEQEFIMQHPELSIDKARKKFQRRFEDKFSIKEEDFDSVEAFKDKKDDLEDDLTIEAAKAKRFIKEKQQEFKKISEDKSQPEEQVNKEVLSSIASNTKAFDEHLNGLDNLIFEVEEDSKNPFIYKFDKAQLTQIKVVADGYLKNDKMYDEKGKLKDIFDPEAIFQRAAFALYGPAMMEEALKSAKKYAQIIKAEQIAKIKPDRKPKSSGDIQDESIDAQTDRLMAKKMAEKKAARGR